MLVLPERGTWGGTGHVAWHKMSTPQSLRLKLMKEAKTSGPGTRVERNVWLFA